MAKKTPYHDFVANPAQAELAPPVSGNVINGLNEPTPRRAQTVYWAENPDDIPHGPLQRWFYTQHADDPHVLAARAARQKILDLELPEEAPQQVPGSAEAWTRRLFEFRESLDCELLGVTRLDPDWVFEGREIRLPNVVMTAVAHDFEEMRHAPEPRAGAEVVRQYGRALKAAKALVSFIRGQGYRADLHGGPMAGPLLLIPPAIACGFGELGRHGSIIHRELGSSFRLAGVTTDMPLIPTPAEHYGVDDFCTRCQVCSNACPPGAIAPEKQTVRGEEKWYVDFDRCLPFFNEHLGCGICVAVCPWSLPGRGPRIVEQLRRRQDRIDEKRRSSG